MKITLLLLTFILGTAAFSFAECTAWRLANNVSLLVPFSQCSFCGRRIPRQFLIPIIGYFLCQGKCSFCLHPIPRIYPLGEFLSGIYACILFLRISSGSLPFILLFCCWGLTLLLEDAYEQAVSVWLLYPGIVFFGFVFSNRSIFQLPSLLNLAFILLLVLAVLLKLFGSADALVIILFFICWNSIFVWLCIMFSSLACCLAYFIFKQGPRALPFLPFLFAGFFVLLPIISPL